MKKAIAIVVLGMALTAHAVTWYQADLASPYDAGISYAAVLYRIVAYEPVTGTYYVDVQGRTDEAGQQAVIIVEANGQQVMVDQVTFTRTELEAQIDGGKTPKEAADFLVKQKVAAQLP